MDGEKYELASVENFEAFLKSLGVPEEAIETLSNAKTVISFKKEGDEYTFTTEGDDEPVEIKFEPGQEFTEKLVGHEVTSVATVEENKITITSGDERGTLTRVYDIQDDEVVVSLTLTRTATAKRIYKKVQES